jgi:adenine-specific DNA-methyltransferase
MRAFSKSSGSTLNKLIQELKSKDTEDKELAYNYWREGENGDEEDLDRFHVETALSLVFRTHIAKKHSNIAEKQEEVSSLDDVVEWEKHVTENHCGDLNASIYRWPMLSGDYEVDKEVLELVDILEHNDGNQDAFGKLHHKLLVKDIRKELGEFYTDERIIDYIVNKSQEETEGLSGKDVLDPACGSGSFLIKALESLVNEGLSLNKLLNEEHVVGFDINPFACEMSLLRIIDLGLDELGEDFNVSQVPVYNIDTLKSFESSYSSRTDLSEFGNSSESQQINEISDIEERDLRSLEDIIGFWEDKKLLGKEVANSEFDILIGNPPYIRIQKMDKEDKEVYKDKFRAATGRFDISVLFIEYGLRVLADDGVLSYITSNKLLHTQYGNGIRGYITDNYFDLLEVLDFTDTSVFDVTVLPAIISIKNQSETPDLDYGVLKKAESAEKECQDLLDYISKKNFGKFHQEKLSVSLNGSSENVKLRLFESESPTDKSAWYFLPERERKIIERIDSEKDAELEEISEKISVGIKTTANYAFVDPLTKEKIEKMDIEKELLEPAISGKNVSRWTIDWSPNDSKNPSYILYPHKEVDGSVTGVDLEEYPNTKKYLNQFEERLKGRDYLQNAGRNWYECWVPQKPSYFEVENKIVTPELVSRNSFALDQKSFYCIGSCYSILLEKDDERFYKYILGVLNSELIEFYLKANSSTQIYSEKFRYNNSSLGILPIIVNENKREKIVELVEEARKNDSEEVENKLNGEVNQVYSLNEKESEVVQEFLKFNR